MSRKRKNTSEILGQVGSRIRSLRLQKGLSQEEFAYTANIHVTTLSEIECGKSNITLITCENLAKALDVPIASFFPEEMSREDEELSRLIFRIQKVCADSTMKEKARYLNLLKSVTDNFSE